MNTRVIELTGTGAVHLNADGSHSNITIGIAQAKTAHQSADVAITQLGPDRYLTGEGAANFGSLIQQYDGQNIVILPGLPLHWDPSIVATPFGWETAITAIN